MAKYFLRRENIFEAWTARALCDKGALSWVVVLVSISTATLEPPPPPDQGGEG